jgi:hypothetical protein
MVHLLGYQYFRVFIETGGRPGLRSNPVSFVQQVESAGPLANLVRSEAARLIPILQAATNK